VTRWRGLRRCARALCGTGRGTYAHVWQRGSGYYGESALSWNTLSRSLDSRFSGRYKPTPLK
jgi:hypothetical protein